MPTRISAPFPDLDLEEASIITVELGNAASKIARIVVHFTQDIPSVPLPIPKLPPVITYGPESPGVTR